MSALLKYALIVTGATLYLAINGCSSMSREECQAIDWRAIGYEDGADGFPASRIGQHRKACGKYSVTPDLAAYQQGRDSGLREFCKPANGYRVGSRGWQYSGVCPRELEPGFVEGYETGRELYNLRSRVNNASNALRSMQGEIERIDSDLIRTSAEILNPTISHEQRAQLLLETKRLSDRRGQLKADIPETERDLARYQRDLDAFRAQHKYVD